MKSILIFATPFARQENIICQKTWRDSSVVVTLVVVAVTRAVVTLVVVVAVTLVVVVAFEKWNLS